MSDSREGNKYTNEEIEFMMAEHIKMGEEAMKTPRKRPIDKTALSYWFPLIEAAGLPVPKTRILQMPKFSQDIIWSVFNGQGRGEAAPIEPFYEELKAAALEAGLPCFLRTAQTSAKHSWKRTCFVQNAARLRQHVFEIAEFSECAGFIGIPWDTWVVREYLPIKPYGLCPRYGDMPVNREFRFFVEDGKVRCFHPYWPLTALQDGGWEVDADEATAYSELCSVEGVEAELQTLAERAGMACGGSWSVDILETERGWFVTDMAEAHKSFHWEGCEKA